MASITDYKVKTVRAQEVDDIEIPVISGWDQIPDRPKNLSDLDSTAASTIEQNTSDIVDIISDITGLGALAYEDLVTELQLANNAVTNAKIAVDAIQGSVIAAGAITETKVATDAISSAKIQAGAIVAGKLAANSIVASNIQAGVIDATKMNVSQLSAITANMGSITAGTITGALVRTASSGTRIQLDYSSNEIQIYSGSTKRARGYSQGWDYYNSSSQLVGSLYASSSDLLLGASSGGEISTASIYYGVGSSGTHSFHVGLSGSTLRMYITDSICQIGDASDYAGFDMYVLGSLTVSYGFEMDGYNRHLDISNDAFLLLSSMTGTDASSLTGVRNGAMYYRSDVGDIRVRIAGAWRSVNVT